jgi:hypothetical protein
MATNCPCISTRILCSNGTCLLYSQRPSRISFADFPLLALPYCCGSFIFRSLSCLSPVWSLVMSLSHSHSLSLRSPLLLAFCFPLRLLRSRRSNASLDLSNPIDRSASTQFAAGKHVERCYEPFRLSVFVVVVVAVFDSRFFPFLPFCFFCLWLWLSSLRLPPMAKIQIQASEKATPFLILKRGFAHRSCWFSPPRPMLDTP